MVKFADWKKRLVLRENRIFLVENKIFFWGEKYE